MSTERSVGSSRAETTLSSHRLIQALQHLQKKNFYYLEHILSGTISVPDPDQRGSTVIRLYLIRIRTGSPDPDPDPLVMKLANALLRRLYYIP